MIDAAFKKKKWHRFQLKSTLYNPFVLSISKPKSENNKNTTGIFSFTLNFPFIPLSTYKAKLKKLDRKVCLKISLIASFLFR
ncbi:MAG: hypothetical protein CMO01_33235 [Thalassobius sp.]|nr:hypothetical protein [Thalassovita sp.]